MERAIGEAKAYLALHAPPPPREGGRLPAQAGSVGTPLQGGGGLAPGTVLMGRLTRNPGEE
eukprot:10551014-Alexandrium_andersonii.AAC.1